YAILFQKVDSQGQIKREMIPIASFEVAKLYKKSGKFDIQQYTQEFYSNFNAWDKKLLKVGQKVFILKTDDEYETRKEIGFQTNRLYVINQFSEGNIWLKYHLEAQSKDEIKSKIGNLKDRLLRKYEIPLEIPEV